MAECALCRFFPKERWIACCKLPSKCGRGDEVVPLDEEMRQRILRANARMAQDGQRVLGVAFRPLQTAELSANGDEQEAHKIIIGLVGMIDPPRPEVKNAVETARTAGIRPVMITGDHPLTAQCASPKISTITDDEDCVTGSQLGEMSIE